MNEQHTNEDNPLAEEIFVFSPSRGIRLNVDAQQLPQQNDATSRFELIANNPLIKTNKNNNLSEYDYYIEDPSNLEIKNEVINDIVFSAGRCCLKKNAVDILYCAFDVFTEERKFDLKNNSSLNFYINILLMYPPELKHNSLLQYFSILHKILENNDITLDYKYLVTNRALEIEWEKCNFVKYNHFKAFFSSMKKFFKVSPLFTEEPFIEENTTNIYQDLLKRTLAGRALAIIQYIVDCDDQLKLLMLFKAIEWLQKLESLKMLLNLNLNFVFNRSKDKVASDLLKQMYGRSTMAFNLQGAEKVPSPIPMARYEDIIGLKGPVSLVNKIGGAGGSSSDQTVPVQQTVERRGSESRGDQSFELSTKPKLAPTKSSDQESSNMDRIRRTDSNSSRRGMPRESIKEDSLPDVIAGSQSQSSSNKMSGQAKTQNKMNLFFDLINSAKYQEDYAGRISNFLKKASKLGYEYVEAEKDKIDSIIMKFKNNYTIDQVNDLIRNYKKFCGDYQILVNYQLIHALESVKASQTTPISKPRQDSERSKSPPRTTNMSALKMLKTNSEKFPTGLQTNLAAASNHSSKDSQQSNVVNNKGLGDDATDSNKLTVIKKDLERRSREKEGQEELKSSSTSALDLHRSKQEKKKIDWPNSRTFAPGTEQASSRGYFERTNRNSDE